MLARLLRLAADTLDPGGCHVTAAPMMLGVPRSGRWPKVRAEWLAEHPECAVCSSRDGIVPHHITPVHIDPARELDRSNLISSCPVHHLWLFHLGSWSSYNVNAREDAALWREKIRTRP